MDNETNTTTFIDRLVEAYTDNMETMTTIVSERDQLSLLVDIILNNTKLSYSGDDLRIEGESIILEYIKACYPRRYGRRQEDLIFERDKKLEEATNKALEEAKKTKNKKEGTV